MLTIFVGSVALSSVSNKVKVFAESFSNNFNFHDSGILLPEIDRSDLEEKAIL